MAIERLNRRLLSQLSPVDRPVTIFDVELKGFGLRLTPPSKRSPTGLRSWIVEYRPGAGGRSVAKRRVTLGSVATLTPEQARMAAKDMLATIRLGSDPAAARAEGRTAKRLVDLEPLYSAETNPLRKSRTVELYAGYWRNHLLPAFGSSMARSITRTELVRFHRKVGQTQRVTANRCITLTVLDPIVTRMNQRHAVVAHNGRTLITTEDRDGSVNFGNVGDLHTLYANQRRSVPRDRTTEKTQPISAYWLHHSQRRTFTRGVAFLPGTKTTDTLNLWRGWAVEPDPTGECARFLDHVRNVVCRGDTSQSEYVFGWLAHLVQRPQVKPGVALVLRGGKGAGKDTVADYLAAIIGRRHCPTVSHENHIVGNFNRRLEAALLLHVQEGTWAGDHKAEGVLKYLVTSDSVEIERKDVDSFSLPSFLRLFISSNSEWTVPASTDERRWAVFNVSDSRQGDTAYFAALRAEMAGTGPAALLAWLQAYDLTGFDVRQAPETVGLIQQKIATLKNLECWWHDVLHLGELQDYLTGPEEKWEVSTIRIDCDALRDAYSKWMRDRRFHGDVVNDRQFGIRLRALIPNLEIFRPGGTQRRTRQYKIPSLVVCRDAFSVYLGGKVDWT